MLQSMTGFGEAAGQDESLAVVIEIRTVNNRYFKLTTRTPDGYGALEPRIESTIRSRVRRGSVHASVRITRLGASDDYRIQGEVLESYRSQLDPLLKLWQVGVSETELLQRLLTLPGVVADRSTTSGRERSEQAWPLVEKTLHEALDHLDATRGEEGRAMQTDLAENCKTIETALEVVRQRAPNVADEYREKIAERVQGYLDQHGVVLEPKDIIREVALFADRCDVSEEIVRLGTHCTQFHSDIQNGEASGRRLDFLIQEMVRESNTIGSKANDLAISQQVIEIKAAIERMREMIQNIE